VVRATGEGIRWHHCDDERYLPKQYPQHSNQRSDVAFRWQKWWCGFVTTGAFWKLRWPRLPPVNGNGTATVCLQPDDVVVADSAYGTYVDLALVRSANADAVFGNIMRVTVIFVGAEVGHWRSYCLAASSACPQSMPPADFGALPASMKCGSPFIDSTTGVSTRSWSPP